MRTKAREIDCTDNFHASLLILLTDNIVLLSEGNFILVFWWRGELFYGFHKLSVHYLHNMSQHSLINSGNFEKNKAWKIYFGSYNFSQIIHLSVH